MVEFRTNNGRISVFVWGLVFSFLFAFVFLASALEEGQEGVVIYSDLETTVGVNDNLVLDRDSDTLQYRAIVGRPVKWVKKVDSQDGVGGIELPRGSEGIKVFTDEDVGVAFEKVKDYDLVVSESDRGEIISNGVLSRDVFLSFEEESVLDRFLKWVSDFGLSGNVVKDRKVGKNVVRKKDSVVVEVVDVFDNSSDLAVEYYTEAPVSNETEIPYGKRIIVSAPDKFGYKDVLAYSDVSGMGIEIGDTRLKMYWYMNEQELYENLTEKEIAIIQKNLKSDLKGMRKAKEAKEIRKVEREIRKVAREAEKAREKEAREREEKKKSRGSSGGGGGNSGKSNGNNNENKNNENKNNENKNNENKNNENKTNNGKNGNDEEEEGGGNFSGSSLITGQVVLDVSSEPDMEKEAINSEVKRLLNSKNKPKGVKVEVKYDSYDLDDDGFVDYIEWIVPHLSVQVYEIIAVDAIHLDENDSEISNIYDEVSVVDGVWSEPVYEGEKVRVWFEENLTEGRVIDFVARSNGTLAYFDVYETGTGHYVGRSGTFGGEEVGYVLVNNLTKPTDVFDFVIRKTRYDEVDNSSSIDEGVDSFLEFDYIHDAYINATQADGFLAYQELNILAPRYRTWDASNVFSSELIDAGSVGADISWVVVKGNHERDEMMIGTLDKDNDVNIQVYTGTWGSQLEVSSDVPNSAYRGFDLAYEDLSGEGLIVYESSSTADSLFYYRTWDGQVYSGKNSLSLTGITSPINWVSLIPKPGTDEMMLLLHDDSSNLVAVPWDGDAFDDSAEMLLTGSSSSATEEHFAFEWMSVNGSGLAVYSEGTSWVYRDYNYEEGAWSDSGTSEDIFNGLDAIRLCRDPVGDYIGIIFQDSGNDVNVRMWNGTAILSGSPTEDTSVEIHGLDSGNIDCAWNRSGDFALFGFIDRDATYMDYFNFTKAGNQWSTSNLETTTQVTDNFGSDDVKTVRFVEHPTNGEMMAVFMDQAEAISLLRWNGTGFENVSGSPVEVSTEVLNGDQEGVMFDWYRYDPLPTVQTPELPDGDTYNAGQPINITVDVADNIEVDSVWMGVTFPDYSYQEYFFEDLNGDGIWNFTFTSTSQVGDYTADILANDTSSHENINEDESTGWTVLESSAPDVTTLLPSRNSLYNVSDVIEIAADATDAGGIDTVFANITYPNSTVVKVFLSNSLGNKYNNSFSAPGVLGNYNVLIVANDSSNNINSSEFTNFSVVDQSKPTLSLFNCDPSGPSLGQSVVCNISVNDNFVVDEVLANLTYPNGTEVSMSVSNLGENFSFSFSGTSVLGRYNITWVANDTSGNFDTSENYFVVGDIVAPAVSGNIPSSGASYSYLTAVEVAVNVTDDSGVDDVFANVTFPNGTVEKIDLANSFSDKYNGSFFTPVLLGSYNVRFFANDTTGNLNSSVSNNFSVVDSTGPVVLVLGCSPAVLNISQTVICNATVSDSVLLDDVWASLNYSNGTSLLLSVSNVSSNYYFSFSGTADIGTHNVTFFANDSSGNFGSNFSSFQVDDVAPPFVDLVSPSLSSSHDVGVSIDVGADVTDDFLVDTVYANISFPNGTIQKIILTNAVGDKYNESFVAPGLLGNYNIAFFANDSSGNYNSSSFGNFTVTDSVEPDVLVLGPGYGQAFSQNDTVNITVNITDGISVDIAYVEVTFPNSSSGIFYLGDEDSDDTWNVSINDTSQIGNYQFNIFANDTSGNYNDAETGSFNILEAGNPIVTLISPAAGSNLNNSNVSFICSVTDAGGLSNVTLYHNIGQPFTGGETKNISGTSNQSTFVVQGVPDGSYSWNCLAFDITGNNASGGANYAFSLDTINPAVSPISPLGGSYNISDTFEIATDVTDANIIYSVYANVGYPNGTISQVDLSYAFGNKYITLFQVPSLIGNYNVTFVAIDFTGNQNSSETGSFSASDATAPVILDLGCSPANLNLSQTTVCNVSATDGIGVDQVFASVTYSNLTTVSLSVSNVSDNYYVDFSGTSEIGWMYINWSANDTSGNFGYGFSSFFVNDVVAPSLTFVLPQLNDVYNISDNMTLAVNVTDQIGVDQVFANVTYPNGTVSLVALSYDSGDRYDGAFFVPALLGNYDVVFFANDTSGNLGTSLVTNFSSQDGAGPTLSSLIPLEDSFYNVSDAIEIAVNVVDEIAVDDVYANITYPNGTVKRVLLNYYSGSKYNNSFVAPGLTGNFGVGYFANDSSGNIDVDSFSNFNVQDVVSPGVVSLGCERSVLNISQNAICNATVTDDVSIDTVVANVTYPNGTVVFVQTSNVSNNYYINFSGTVAVGGFNVTFVANDSGNNFGTDVASFSVEDVVGPSINLKTPVDNYNMSDSVGVFGSFVFNVTDDSYSLFNCSFYVDGVLNGTASSVASGEDVSFDAEVYGDGVHNWSASCSDGSSNLGNSAVWDFTVDNDLPIFVSLITSPNSPDGLDPNKTIGIFAEVDDNSTSIDEVTFQYKPVNGSSYSNTSMVYNSSTGFWFCNWSVSSEGNYSLRLWARDLVNNTQFSSVFNRTLDLEYSWKSVPASSFSPIIANLSDEVTFDDLLINNTGDFDLNFTIFSNSNYTTYNVSENFSLTAGAWKVISINDTASDAGAKTVTLNVSAFGNGTGRGSKLITQGIVVAPGQPILVARFLDPSDGVLSVTQGQTGVGFNARLRNDGEGDAYNTSFLYSLPSGWSVSFGSGVMTFEDTFYSGDDAENYIELTVPSGAPVGDYIVSVSADGVNSSGGDISSFIFEDYITVTVLPSQSFSGGGGGGSSTPAPTAPSGGGGGSGQKLEGADSETIYTTERLSAIRGTTERIPITITNLYESTYFENVTLEMRGFLTQYVKVVPDFDSEKRVFVETKRMNLFVPGALIPFNLTGVGIHNIALDAFGNGSANFSVYSSEVNVSLNERESRELDLDGDGVNDSAITLWSVDNGVANVFLHKLGPAEENKVYFLEKRNYTLEIFAPPYLEKKDYEVTLDIAAELVAQDPIAAGFESKPFLEQRTLIFSLLERSNTEALKGLSDANESIRRMKEAGFVTNEVEGFFTQAQLFFEELNYEDTLRATERVLEIANNAFEADSLIRELRDGIDRAKERLLDVEESEAALLLATKAFERGDFETALERAKDAELTYILETKGRISWLWAVINFWWLMIISAFVLFFVLFTAYRKSYTFVINQRLKNITKEEASINALMDEAQVEYLTKGSISPGRYKQAISEYEERLNDLKHLRLRLRNRRIGILKTEQEIKNLAKERAELIALIKTTQEDYFNRHKFTERKFRRLYNLEKSRLVEVDEEMLIMQEKLVREKNTRFHKFLAFLSRVDKKINDFFIIMMERLQRWRI